MPCLSRSELSLLGLTARRDGGGGRLPFEEPGVEPHYAPSWTFRITHADLSLSLFPEERRWEGRIAHAIEPLATWTGEARFDLADVELEAVEDADGGALSWRRVEGAVVVQAGEARTVVFRFRGRDPRAGLYFVGPDAAHPDRRPMAWTQLQDEDAHFVFPCLDHPRIRHPWTITVEGPAHWTLLSNGARIRHDVSGDRATAVWQQDKPAPAYLITVVGGELDVHEGGSASVPVRYLVPTGTPADRVARSMSRTPEMIACFEDWTSTPYPWPRYDQVVVHDFVFGGMENTGATTMTELLLVDDRVGPHWDAEGLVSHELAHQWFGDLVTCQDWSQGWLNESFATFLETVWEAHAHGADRGAWLAFEHLRAYLSEDEGRYRRAIESYGFVEPIDVFDRHLYEKGAVVLRTLQAELGERAFRAGVALYLSRHAHEPVHARHLQRALEDATGVNLDGFFTRWIRTPGHPSLRVTIGIRPELVTLDVAQTQEGEGVPKAWPLKLPVEIALEDGSVVSTVLDVRRREATFHVPVSGRVDAVAVDPELSVLATVALEGDVHQLARLADDPRPVLAARAVAGLAKKGGRAAMEAVARAARSHPFFGVRADAIGAWGKAFAEDEGLELLHDALVADEDSRVRSAAARALGARRTARAFDVLAEALDAGPPTWQLTADLLIAMGQTRDARAHERLVPHLETASWGETVARGALEGLSALRTEAALDAVLAWTEAPRDDRAISGAAKALGALAEALPKARRRARERLEVLARTGGFRTQVGAVDALGTAGDPDAMPVLRQLHEAAADGRVRRGAWEAIARLTRHGEVPDQLTRALSRLDELESLTRTLRTRLDTLEPSRG